MMGNVLLAADGTPGSELHMPRFIRSRPIVGIAALFAAVLALLATVQTAGELASIDEPVPWFGIAFGHALDFGVLAAAFVGFLRVARWHRSHQSRWWAVVAVQLGLTIVASVLCLAVFYAGCEIAAGLGVSDARAIAIGSNEALGRIALLNVVANLLVRLLAKDEGGIGSPPPMDSLMIREGAHRYILPISEIRWIDAQGNYARLHVQGARRMMRTTMSDLQRRLGTGFLRIHRGVIVNRAAVRRIDRVDRYMTIVLDDGTALPVGRSYADAVRSVATARP